MSELHDDAAAYALDALDPVEQAEFERHLAGCADCTAEVAELREAASLLVLSGGAPPLPPSLRASVLAGITDVEQLPPLPGRPRRALASVDPEPDEAEPRPAAEILTSAPFGDELAVRRASRRARVLSVLVAAVSVVALALGGVVYSLARQQQPVVAGPAPTTSVRQVDPSLLAAPDAKIVRKSIDGVNTSFVVSKSQNRAAFVSTDLPDPGQGNVYHLWTLKGDTVVRPDATFAAQDQGVQLFTGPVDDSTALAINVEPAGTDPTAPTTPVLGAVKI